MGHSHPVVQYSEPIAGQSWNLVLHVFKQAQEENSVNSVQSKTQETLKI